MQHTKSKWIHSVWSFTFGKRTAKQEFNLEITACCCWFPAISFEQISTKLLKEISPFYNKQDSSAGWARKMFLWQLSNQAIESQKYARMHTYLLSSKGNYCKSRKWFWKFSKRAGGSSSTTTWPKDLAMKMIPKISRKSLQNHVGNDVNFAKDLGNEAMCQYNVMEWKSVDCLRHKCITTSCPHFPPRQFPV